MDPRFDLDYVLNATDGDFVCRFSQYHGGVRGLYLDRTLARIIDVRIKDLSRILNVHLFWSLIFHS